MYIINHIGYAAFVGMISVILWRCYATEMTLCTDDSMPCVVRYGETQKVCAGDSVYTNMTLRVPSTIGPQAITISVQGHQFSEGPFVSGEFHNGDNHISRWKNRISFQGNNVTYEIWNSYIEHKDEFESNLEINIEGERFISKPFKWFEVKDCISGTEPVSMEKDTSGQTLMNNTKKLDQILAAIDALASEMAELRKMKPDLQSDLKDVADNITDSIQESIDSSNQSLKNKLDSLKDIGIADIILYILRMFATILMLMIACRLGGIRGQRETQGNSHRPSSGSADDPQFQNTDIERGSTSTELIDLHASGNTQERSHSMLSLAPQDEAETADL